jgi:release factor glutamine methyltransferase
MGIELLVAPGALVPRAETELLGRTALAVLQHLAVPAPRVIDMCCGSGNLACGIAYHAPSAVIWASDLTDACAEMARRNVERLGLSDRISVRQGDLFDGLHDMGLTGKIDVIVCNPPYISAKRLDGDRAELLRHEPRVAFDGGPYGLSIHQRVMRDAPRFLRPGGTLLFEIGLGQHRQVESLFRRAQAYGDVKFATDDGGSPRVAYACLS